MKREISDAIEKLIGEYKFKVENCDITVEALNKQRSLARKNSDIKTLGVLAKEIAIKEAQRQAYLQAKVDIESLTDYT